MTERKVRPIQIAVFTPAQAHLAPGAAYLLKLLSSDVRFTVSAFIEVSQKADGMSVFLSSYIALEGRIFAPSGAGRAPAKGSDIAVLTPEDDCSNIDVILDLADACETDVKTWSEIVPFGVWRASNLRANAGVHETFSGAAFCEAVVDVFHEGGWRAVGAARYDTKFIAGRNRAFQHQKAAGLLIGALANLAVTRQLPFGSEISTARLSPSSSELPSYWARAIKEAGKRVYDKIRAKLGRRPGRFALRVTDGTPLDFDIKTGTTFEAPAGHFWADPFFAKSGDETKVFYEDFDYARGLGHLAVASLNADELTVLGDTHKPDHHLSFPHVFEHDGAHLMLLESGAVARQELWRATDFPLKWELHKTIFEGTRCADTVLFEHAGAWWLFTNICHDDFNDFCGELYAFRVDGPELNEIEPHRLNPIVVGSDRARGAGRVFVQDGKLYRPSQDNTHGSYGYGLNIMEIEELTIDTYAERRVRHITPQDDPSIIGCHHIDWMDGRVIVDVRYA